MQVTISPKYQVVIPKDIRRRLNLRPGQRVHVMAREHSIVFIPVIPIQELRGMFPGLDTTIEREPDRL